MNIKFICSLVLLSLVWPAAAKAQTEQWVARYNGQGEANSIAVDSTTGTAYVTGFSTGAGTGQDYATVAYDATGTELWVARYDGPGHGSDVARGIALDNSTGNVYVTGYSWGVSMSSEYATVAYDSTGSELWVARYNGPGNGSHSATAIAVDSTGNVYVTGISWGGTATQFDYATIKYDATGTELWVARYNGPASGNDGATAIAVDSGTGNVYVTGNSLGTGQPFGDYATVAYDRTGMQLWVARYTGPGNMFNNAKAIAVDSRTGNVYVTGESMGIGTFTDYATVAYDSNGAQLWVARYNGPGNDKDEANAIAVDGAGNVYVTGESAGLGTLIDYATVAYDSNGAELWVARYNGPANGYDIANAIAVDSSGSVYVTGRSEGIGTGYDYATIAYNSATAAEQWVARYNGPGNGQDIAYAIAVDSTRNVYVTGGSTGIGTGDFATIKYSQP
jgi:hypothetical protein